jgi:hypothetical protein
LSVFTCITIHGELSWELKKNLKEWLRIETEAGIVGIVYVPKSAEGMPKKIILEYEDNPK